MSSFFEDRNSDSTNHKLTFDGKKLRLYANGEEIASWNGVSGMKGYQSYEFQHLKNKGPLPEGEYDVKQDEYSKMIPFFSEIWWRYGPKIMGRKTGSWQGGADAWGTQKIGLNPSGNQEMYGRGGFFIHGGKYPGSSGCIDLTGVNDNFMETFLKLDKDLPLEVKYRRGNSQ